ncbi:MAG TPA: hypothetical protein VMQ76_12705 [Terracidiphilus sp.]|nr:hypothetical protein [Terracidiphilus sp.]
MPGGWRFFPFGGPTPEGPLFPDLLAALQWPQLAAARVLHKPLDGPVASLLQTRRGVAGELELASIRTIVYSADPPGPKGEVYGRRRERISNILNGFGFRDWRFHIGETLPPSVDRKTCYCSLHCRDHRQFCIDNDPPLLVLEDDAEPAWVPSHFVPPAGADRLHIGGDWHGVDLARLLGNKTRKDWRREHGYLWRPYDKEWFWECGMLAYHACLYLTRRMMDAVADYLPGKTGAVDAVVCELDHRFNVAAPRRCWFWQNDGHNGDWSFQFTPRDLRGADWCTIPP